MGFVRFASTQVLSVERETSMSRTATAAGFRSSPEYEVISTEAGKTAHRAHFDYERRPGYIYVRSRAISSRTNDNFDEFPAPEIKKAWRTFIGKPCFVNHHNDDHRRARGVIIDAALHEDTNPDGTPDTWAEVLMEIDAKRFPRLAEEIIKGNIARTSMGTNVEYSVCTACGNKAYSPVEYCQHIPRMKGMKMRRTTASGAQEETLIAERCYGLGFFENSLLVEDPADPTAYVLGVDGAGVTAKHDHVDRAIDQAEEEMEEEWSKDQTKVSVSIPRQMVETNPADPIAVAYAAMEQAKIASLTNENQCPYCGGEGVLEGDEYHCPDCGRYWPDISWRSNEQVAHDLLGHRHAVNEVKAPAQVDTMRAERCPVCQDDDAYDGERCGICGYVAPPDMFKDPDLDKAKQVDLRQDQMAKPDEEGNLAVDTQDVESSRVLKCDHCGEEFGPDEEAVGPALDPSADPQGAAAPTDAKVPGKDQDQKPEDKAQVAPAADPTNPHGTPVPDDLSDLADKTDEELGLEDKKPDPQQPDAKKDPQQEVPPMDPAQQQPDDQQDQQQAADDGSLTDQQVAPDGSPLDDTDTVDKGDICPICGQGTIVSVPAGPADPTDPKEDPVGSKPMPEQDPTKKAPPVNPAKATRNRLVLALMGQQREIVAQREEIASLRETVLVIGTAAGLGQHPRFVALRKQADDTNQTPEGTPATTSDGARPPDANDDPTNVGAAPDGANVNVTPQAVTDVSNTDKVEPGNPPLSNLVDVTAPPPSGVTSAPAAGDGDKVINPVTIGTPSTNVMDPAGSTGWTSKSSVREDPMERHTACLRYARLRIAAGLDRGEDLALAEQISASGTTLETIKAQAALLSESLSAQQANAPTRAQAQRLVPRSAQGSRTPSLGGVPADDLSVTAADGGLDEWAIGLNTLGD